MTEKGFLAKHSEKLSKKYSGKYIAVVKENVVAAEKDALKAFTRAKKTAPKEHISIFYMPTEKETVTLL